MSLEKKINLRTNEEVVMVIKRGFWDAFWRYLLGFIFLVVASFFMFLLFSYSYWGYGLFTILMVSGCYIIIHSWYFNRKNFIVITSERIVAVSRRRWFEEIVIPVFYSDVNEIYLKRQGFFSNLFNFGSIIIKFNNGENVFNTSLIKDPQSVLDSIHHQKSVFANDLGLKNVDLIYKKFIKIIPDLTEEEICEVVDLLNQQLQELDNN